MKDNPEIGKKTNDSIESFRIGDTDIKCKNNVTLLSINIASGFMPKFDYLGPDIC